MSFQQIGLRQLCFYIQNNEFGPLPHTIYKNQIKMDSRHKNNTKNPKTLRKKSEVKTFTTLG